MSNCVCGHIRALHRLGVCFARINPCGCSFFEDEQQADRPSGFPLTDRHYEGRYAGKKFTL